MFELQLDAKSGVLTVRPVGSWTREEIARYADALLVHVPKARKLAGRLLMLIDNRQCELATRELAEPLGKAGQRVAADDDRIAIVVSSTLMKLQTHRLLNNAAHQVFLGEPEARAWLSQATLH